MPYIVVNREGLVLSRMAPNALLTWERSAHHAITFETYSGALKCAGMQGGVPVRREGDQTVSDPSTPTSVRRGLGSWMDGDSDFGLAF